MKTLLITLLLSISIFGQSGKSVLTQAQKDSIGAMISDSSGYVTPENYGAVGDGITDDADAINNALDYARTVKKPLVLKNKTYYVTEQLDVSDVSLFGGGSTILANIPAVTSKVVLSAAGSVGSSYDITEIAKRGDQFIKVTNATFLASVSAGDIIMITSSRAFGNDGGYQGEQHEIKAVYGWGVTFNDYLFDTYLLSDSPKIKKITTTAVTIRDLTIVSTSIDSTEKLIGINIVYAYKPVIQNVTIKNTFHKGVSFESCYAPQLSQFQIENTKLASLGYGVNILSSTMYARITDGTILGARHCISAGGGASGVPWDATITNVSGTIGIFNTGGTVFDAHESVGSIRYYNCRAYSGLMADDYLTPVYSADTTYNLSAPVYSSDGYVYVSLANSNQGNGLTDLTKWKPSSGNLNAGFNVRANDIRIINCEAYNGLYGIVGSGADSVDNVDIINFYGRNNELGLVINTSVMGNLSINGFREMGDKTTSNEAINISGEVYNVKLNDIEVKNHPAIVIYNDYDTSKTLLISNVKAFIENTFTSSIGIKIGSYYSKMTNITLDNYDELVNYVSVIKQSELEIDGSGFSTSAVRFVQDVDNAIIYGSIRDARAAVYLGYFREDINNFSVPYLTYYGTNQFYLSRTRDSKTYGSLQYGLITMGGSGAYVADHLAGDTDPSIIILSGSNKNIRDCIVSASPEGSVTASIGATARDKTNGKLYYKESGSSNTGWKEVNNDVSKTQVYNFTPIEGDSVQIDWVSSDIMIDSIKFRSDDSVWCRITFGEDGIGSNMLSNTIPYYLNGEQTRTQFIDNTIPTGDEIYLHFDSIGVNTTSFGMKIYSHNAPDAPAFDAELVSNGGFDSDTLWTKNTGWSITGGVAVATATVSTLTQGINANEGVTYEVTYTILNYSAGQVRTLVGGQGGTLRSADGTYVENIKCDINSGAIALDGISGAFTGQIDNISVIIK